MGFWGPPDVEKMMSRRDVNGLIKALGYKKDYFVQEEAAAALGEVGDPKAVEPLYTVLKDEGVESAVRKAAARALVKIGISSGEHDRLMKAALFEPVNTKNPKGAVAALFEQALPAVADASPEVVQRKYEDILSFYRSVKDKDKRELLVKSQTLLQGSAVEIKARVLANLKRIHRHPNFGEFIVDTDLTAGAGLVVPIVLWAPAEEVIPVQVWRSQDVFFACGAFAQGR